MNDRSNNKLAIIGIDSLDPHLLVEYRKELPNFSELMGNSPTLISNSVFPVDTIPAWMSVFTGLNPANHGLMYIYDVFDATLSDLKKLDTDRIKGNTFWDYMGQAGYQVNIIYPPLIYPSWEVNGIMVNKSPFDKRIDWITTEIDIDTFPKSIKQEYKFPEHIVGLWGGFPGEKRLKEWAEIGKKSLDQEKRFGIELFKNDKWSLFFIYFSILDIIQHRLWRYFDKGDPIYRECNLSLIILDYYKMIDKIIGEFIQARPDLSFIIMSDHGHRSRPFNTVNINEYLRRLGYLKTKGRSDKAISFIKKSILEIMTTLNIEHLFLKLIVKSRSLTKTSKLIYSSAGSIDKTKSLAYLSNFAGIKSYSHGGIEINKDIVSPENYEPNRGEIIALLSNLKISGQKSPIKWAIKREELYQGKYTKEIYPDIVFELLENLGTGWDIQSDLEGKAYDHKLASGGHSKEAVFLIRNIARTINKKEINLIDVAPTILDLMDMDWKGPNFDGRSIFAAK